MLCPLDLWILEIWAHSLWFVSKQRLEPSRNIGICGYTSLESPRNKIRGKKLQMTARLGSSAHTKMLIYIQGWSCFCYVCIKKHEIKKKKGYSPCAITQAFGACARVHLSAFVYELFVCAPQALGCWVCSLKRLCFCCHPSLSLSFPLCVSRSHLDSPTCFVCRLYRSPSPFCPSVFHYQCFIIIVGKSTRRNVGGLSHSQPFTSSTGNDLMLFKREAG